MKLMRYRKLFFAISLLFLLPGIFSLFRNGLKPAIDFTGGSLLEIKFTQTKDDFDSSSIKREDMNAVVAELYEFDSLQSSGEQQLIIRGKDISNDLKNNIMMKIVAAYGPVEEIRFETVGPTLGKELLVKTLAAVFIVSLLIILYVWKQFKEVKFGVCAILAMFHDSLILLGSFSLLGHFFDVEVDVLFVTAILTTLSFSIHDTIVVFDRIRELKRKHPRQTLDTIANAAVLETLARSINNSVTIIVMLLALVLLGGETIRWFATALLIGAVTGTYSSTFTAVPLLLVWEDWQRQRKMA